jgi:hypothetical protein
MAHRLVSRQRPAAETPERVRRLFADEDVAAVFSDIPITPTLQRSGESLTLIRVPCCLAARRCTHRRPGAILDRRLFGNITYSPDMGG